MSELRPEILQLSDLLLISNARITPPPPTRAVYGPDMSELRPEIYV